MKRFNPNKELNKIRYGNKNKIIIGLCMLLFIVVVGYSFALYQVKHSNKLVYTVVKPFNNKDITLAVYLDNVLEDDFPSKEDSYIYDKIVCDNNNDKHVTAYWNYDKWALELETSKKAKCNVYFKSGTDRSGANAPELYQGLIPITIEDDGTIKVADITKEWYNYQEHKWANAVLIDDENSHSKYYKDDGSFNAGTIMDLENDILQMYVWIPRYKYQLWNATNGQTSQPQEIKIKFEHGTASTGEVSCTISDTGVETCTRALNGNWYTHPAFKFGDTELTGIWIGKFESSGNVSNVVIKPNIPSLHNIIFNEMFQASRNIEIQNAEKYNIDSSKIDTHMMKNSDWGAVAYLTNSVYGRYNNVGTCVNGECETWINNTSNCTTGCAGSSVSASQVSTCSEEYIWTKGGVKASNTNNVSGLYDMSGGCDEFVTGNMVYSKGFSPDQTGLTDPGAKYYELYQRGNIRSNSIGHLGDATRETTTKWSAAEGQWNGDESNYTDVGYLWFERGGFYYRTTSAGIFAVDRGNGLNYENTPKTFRVVLTAQDGDE